jgi:hypothetical protein
MLFEQKKIFENKMLFEQKNVVRPKKWAFEPGPVFVDEKHDRPGFRLGAQLVDNLVELLAIRRPAKSTKFGLPDFS